MGYIDEKFKDKSPEETVEKIISILNGIGIYPKEKWYESGIDNCWSLTVSTEGDFPFTSGKGVSKEFARASAYGEYIERLESGLFFYKYQSLECDPELDLQAYAPDAKYMTKQELIENGEWMDYIIKTYGGGLTRESLASQCEMYAHSEDGKILTVPFYSVFEDKLVYLPTGFLELMYSANGCCVGNTKEEAIVHALSEIMERKGSIKMLTSGEAVPEIPEKVLKSFPTVTKILKQMKERANLDVKVFDCSIGNGFPVVAVRIINKDTHTYVVNVAADPILEIAIQRTLTESFQGRNVRNFTSGHIGRILNKTTDIPIASNVLNQLERAHGVYTVDFFAEELTCDRECSQFEDNSGLDNKQLVQKLLKLYKNLNMPLYMRNYNFLGFPCYKVIVPGFSESRGLKLNDPIQEYAIGHKVSKALRNPKAATDEDLNWILFFRKMIASALSRIGSFTKLSGIPLDESVSKFLLQTTLAYANYRLNAMGEVSKQLEAICNNNNVSMEEKNYFACVRQYIEFKQNNVDENKIFCVLEKFYNESSIERLKKALHSGTPFDSYLLTCSPDNCAFCQYKELCNYNSAKKIIKSAGKIYSKFENGQNSENFVRLEE